MMVHASNGFFMNWMGNEKAEGFEYHLLALGLSLVAIVGGGGKGSVDSLLARSRAEQSHPDSSKESRINLAHARLAMERKSTMKDLTIYKETAITRIWSPL